MIIHLNRMLGEFELVHGNGNYYQAGSYAEIEFNHTNLPCKIEELDRENNLWRYAYNVTVHHCLFFDEPRLFTFETCDQQLAARIKDLEPNTIYRFRVVKTEFSFDVEIREGFNVTNNG